jgi:hypothetical protein
MLTRTGVLTILDHMTDEFSINDFIEKILILDKIDEGRKEIADDEGIDWEVLKREMDSWN